MSEFPLIESIESPADIKEWSIEQLEELAAEMRQRLISVISKTGGHLGSNLGVVELTIALHKVFDSPTDKFIWDTSHQSYIHKMLTGRNHMFEQLRQFEGLCGFCHPDESPHDHFHAGHAGTALSLALGVAKNRDLSQRNEFVVPILGDSSVGCGLTLEALNNIKRSTKRFVVILNDNAMSISRPVGAITNVLSRLLSNPTSHRIYQDLDAIVSRIPSVGQPLAATGLKITESLKNLVSPAVFFEHFGLSYIGPVDGHSIPDLVRCLEGVKDSNWPVVIHAITVKGKGVDVAVENPTTWHGAKPFNPDTYKIRPAASARPTFPKIFGKHIVKMAENDPSVVAITPAMSAGSCLDPMMERFPERCMDVGIAEGHGVTFAGGIAYGKKMKVVMSIYGTFLHRALDNLFHDVCLQENPVVFAIDRGGLSGPDGRTHHGIYDISFMLAMPNMIITQPRDGHVLKELLESSFSYGKPTAIRYPNQATDEPDKPLQKRELGKGEVLAQGEKLLIIALGHTCNTALKVREMLIAEGVAKPTVMDPIFVKPLDKELLGDLLMTHDQVVTIEEHSVTSGLGSVVNNFLITHGFGGVQVLNCGVPDVFLDQGANGDLLEKIGLTPEAITRKVKSEFSLRSPALAPA